MNNDLFKSNNYKFQLMTLTGAGVIGGTGAHALCLSLVRGAE